MLNMLDFSWICRKLFYTELLLSITVINNCFFSYIIIFQLFTFDCVLCLAFVHCLTFVYATSAFDLS